MYVILFNNTSDFSFTYDWEVRMRHTVSKTYETALMIKPRSDEKLVEISASYDYDSGAIDIEYIYDLESASYIDIDAIPDAHYRKIEAEVEADLTATGHYEESEDFDDNYGDF